MHEPTPMRTIEATVDAILQRIGERIVLAIPLGIGKPNPLVNALYRRIKADPSLHLKILTALSLQRPVGHSDLERRFLSIRHHTHLPFSILRASARTCIQCKRSSNAPGSE